MNTLKSSIMSGIAIGTAGIGFLATRDIVGSVLFAFALITVVSYKLKLYTGTAGFIKRNEVPYLLYVLAGNLVGCFIMAMLTRCSPLELQASAQNLLEGRLAVGPLRGGLLAIGCGFIMTTAVTFARKGNNLPLLFGVPLFITCGFPHCAADAFFYMTAPLSFWSAHLGEILIFYVSIVIGNFVGCNAYRWVMGSNPE
ncbi:MAG: formate/nitrite transporter family protein [Bacteroidaceae bacterium]|nr:formate/nitrite transporter family protein [Bacteroidaceae bacterium]MBQ5835636.1 formate/nitrite transporter family protein [Bacteroidaceae bacterium]MBQ5909984.1 formate/nitrite transporter family protein [Bacteroidaceae bacterium]MBR4935863.1 formate/nitrite transporter family protein [Bacteroidaceae bacterium]MBR5530022.1 formate/nitrite transporter family protein [Bacteroidaceae bacterium]